MTKSAIVTIAACALALAASVAHGEEKREHGAHVHGHGKLNIAIEGGKVSMSLEVPGADIVGFEHKPKTKKQHTALAQAKKKLGSPLTLFVPPAEAGCKVSSRKVGFEIEGESGEKGHGHKHGHSHGHKHGHDKDEDGHAEFRATFTLTCASPAKFTSLDFAYFNTFPGAKTLEVQLIAPKGASKYEVTRKARFIKLKGVN